MKLTRSNRGTNEFPREPKRQRCVHEPTEVTVEAKRSKGRKRKASVGTSRERQRAPSNNADEATSVSVQDVRPTQRNKGTKRKASSETKATRKRLRATSNNTIEEVRPAERVENPKQQPDAYTEHLWTAPSQYSTSRDDFLNKYQQLEKLGQGAYGYVYAGYRRSDNLPVAIKHIRQDMMTTQKVVLNNRTYMIPMEVLIMQRMAGGPDTVGTSVAVSLIDWYNLDREVVLVIERPVHCEVLSSYVKKPLKEHQVKNIMRQLVLAACEMSSKGVCHGDINLNNILVETGADVPRVRVIDFGCSWFVGTMPFPDMPENYADMTVQELDVVLRNILGTDRGFYVSKSELNNPSVSQDCRDFLRIGLNSCPLESVTVEELQQHPWIKT